MTGGSPFGALLFYSLPLIAGNFMQQLYNTVDSLIVGRFVGDAALAAVGGSGQIINFLLAFLSLLFYHLFYLQFHFLLSFLQALFLYFVHF